jgi:hypothetical protein
MRVCTSVSETGHPKNNRQLADKCAHSYINSLGMTASTNVGNSPKRSKTPLWRRKANYVLRELVRAWHGLPYDTAVIWGFRFALDDIVHTFAKENRLNFPKLCYWFNQAWREVAECFGKRALTIQDWQKFKIILSQSAPAGEPWKYAELIGDECIEEVLFLASRLYLREDGYMAKEFGDYCLRHCLAYYEALEVAPLESFTIWYVKRKYGGLTET